MKPKHVHTLKRAAKVYDCCVCNNQIPKGIHYIHTAIWSGKQFGHSPYMMKYPEEYNHTHLTCFANAEQAMVGLSPTIEGKDKRSV